MVSEQTLNYNENRDSIVFHIRQFLPYMVSLYIYPFYGTISSPWVSMLIYYYAESQSKLLSLVNIPAQYITFLATRMGSPHWDFAVKETMAATIGNVEEFQPELESIAAYLERVELFFDANNVATGRRVPMFLSVIGSKNYSLYSETCSRQRNQVRRHTMYLQRNSETIFSRRKLS